MEDIFVCPKLKKIDSSKQAKDEYEENLIDGKALFEFPKQHSKIIIMGADQSGKTTFVKKLAVDYQRNGFLPLFIRDKEKFFQGNFERRIEKAFAEQYESECDYKEISQNKIVLLIDDFQYLYYFFAGKFFAEESDEEFKDDVEEITNNLHLDENAYIAIFIAHHTKKGLLPEKLLNLCDNLFKQEQSASLTKDNVAFFDVQANQILPTSFDVGKSEENRQKDLARKNELENRPIEEPNDVLAVDLRRSFKTVEVLGQIIKNRAGSLPKTELVQLYDKAMNVMLRLLSNFLNLIKPEKNQDEIIAYIKDCIEKAERDDATLKSDVV